MSNVREESKTEPTGITSYLPNVSNLFSTQEKPADAPKEDSSTAAPAPPVSDPPVSSTPSVPEKEMPGVSVETDDINAEPIPLPSPARKTKKQVSKKKSKKGTKKAEFLYTFKQLQVEIEKRKSKIQIEFEKAEKKIHENLLELKHTLKRM
jgi:hypothetical protein